MTNGSTSSFTGIVTSNIYSSRLQPILLSAGVAGQNPIFSLCYDFHLKAAVNNSPCSFSASTVGDNGNAYQIVNNRNSARSETFLYDSLNRIGSGQSGGTQWGEAFTIDAWGNMTAIGSFNGKPHESLSTSANTNNQLVGFGYDPPGNMTSNGSTSYVYDAENRLIATGGYSYIYDGDGQRVEKCTEGTTPGTCASGATGTLYWRGTSSAALSETDLAGNVQNNYIFFNGQRIARRDSAGAVHYYFSDQLGSHGVVENATASVCEQDIDYYPYGGVEHDYCPNVAQNYKFTGKEQDTESGLDNSVFRYLGSSLGRFMTPDPAGDAVANPSDPQSWNRYAYVLNNPLALLDPFGLDDDCGGPCRPFSYTDGACNVDVSYSKQATQDGNTYDIPMFDVSCPPPPGPSTSTPSAAAKTATISVYHPSVSTCLGQAAISAGEDLLGVSMLPGSDQDNWAWSSDKLGFVYTAAADADSLSGTSNGVDVVDKMADFVAGTPAAQGEIRQFLRSEGQMQEMQGKCRDRRDWHHCFLPMWEHPPFSSRNFTPLPPQSGTFLILSAMARFARVVVVDVAHHVTQRGNARQVILSSDGDRATYLELLRHYSELHDLALPGYCLMSNHVHLIVVPRTAEALAEALKLTHGRYASYWNARNSSSGHVWQGRFYSCPLDETHLWRALRYVELNPVRAGMVPEAAEWRWSSAAAHCGSSAPEPLLEMERWRKRWTVAEWSEHLAARESASDVATLRQYTHTGRPLGSEEFVADLEHSTLRALVARKAGRPKKRGLDAHQEGCTFAA